MTFKIFHTTLLYFVILLNRILYLLNARSSQFNYLEILAFNALTTTYLFYFQESDVSSDDSAPKMMSTNGELGSLVDFNKKASAATIINKINNASSSSYASEKMMKSSSSSSSTSSSSVLSKKAVLHHAMSTSSQETKQQAQQQNEVFQVKYSSKWDGSVYLVHILRTVNRKNSGKNSVFLSEIQISLGG